MDNFSDSEIKQLIRQKYESILCRKADNSGIDHHFSLINEKKITLDDLDAILKNSQEYKTLQQNITSKSVPEPRHIFVSCFNNNNEKGGVFFLDVDDSLKPIFNKKGCYGLYFEKEHNILFIATRSTQQIIALKIIKNKFTQIPIILKNYIFSEDAHGLWIKNGKLYLVGSDGEINGQKASNIDGPGNFVGKVIISNIIFKENLIEITNSKISNPFNCDHHHHVNDLYHFNNNFYLSSFSYCDKNNNYKKSGAISRVDFNGDYELIIDRLDHPHSIVLFRERFYLCSSSYSKIFSFDLNEKNLKLEYKGPDTFLRGLVPTDKFFYFGISNSMGRTGSKNLNDTCALLRMDRKTGEIKKFSFPSYCDNLYSIISD